MVVGEEREKIIGRKEIVMRGRREGRRARVLRGEKW